MEEPTGWGDLPTILRDAGLGLASIAAIYKVLGPWIARTLEQQRARAAAADEALAERLERVEQELGRLRAENLDLVRENAGLRALEASVAAKMQAAEAEARALELERTAAVADLERARVQLLDAQQLAVSLRAQLDRRS